MLGPSLCLLLLCLFHNLILPTFSSSNQWFCHEDEHHALISFKQSITFTQPYNGFTNQINSWKNGTDCCEWEGIKCHPLTHHIMVLNLTGNGIVGIIHSNNTLFHLLHLRVIILSLNHFSYSSISPNFRHFHFLKHLDLSESEFSGTVPNEIGQLSRLKYLDLSYNSAGLKFPSSKMVISNLTKLRTLSLSGISLDSQSLESVTNLFSLKYIELSNCSLRGKLPTNILNLPHIRALNLMNNDLTFPSTPSSFFNNRTRSWSSPLEYLHLSSTNFSSNIPSFFSQFSHLKTLELANCSLHGSIPEWVWNVSQNIELTNNELIGRLPSKIHNTSKLHNLISLGLRNNLLFGEVPSWLFSLGSLELIDLSYNHFSGSIGFYHDVFSNFPNLKYVSFGNSGLSVTLNTNEPVESSALASSLLVSVLLFNTSIYGVFPKWLQQLLKESAMIDLDISQNMLTGRLPNVTSTNIEQFFASNNKFTGPIDSSLCNMPFLMVLDLSNNNLSGNFPHCLGSQSDRLTMLDLGSNNIQGTLPTNFSMFSSLVYLNLSSNLLEGQLPLSLAQCTQLQVIDMKGNNLVDKFPILLHTLPNLQILDLSYNRLHGPITNVNLNHPFSKLQILDLSNNNFNGKIPTTYFKNFNAMMRLSNNHLDNPQYLTIWGRGYYYYYAIELTMKGVHQYYDKINEAIYAIDLSNNAFEGEIPESIGQLAAIRGLNLSHNHLTGHIPLSTGNLSQLESLDLSSNRLTGHIPQQLVSLTFLGTFNVSNNQLSGRIPTGNNFDTYKADSYKGNHELYGPPLTEYGTSATPAVDNNTRGNQDDDDDDNDDGELSIWEMVMMGFGTGVVIGLAWGYCMFTLGRPLWFVRLPHKLLLLLFNCRNGPIATPPTRITSRI